MTISFTKYLLGEKHKLSKIWLAAHWEKKIKRTQIFEIDVEESVHDIMEDEIILDLRICGHLLVGVVRIHSRKTKYLLTDCSNIFYEVKIFHAGRIDLPESKQTASVDEITLTENFNENFGDLKNDMLESVFSANQSRIEDITLRETHEELTLFNENDMMDFEYYEENEVVDIGNLLHNDSIESLIESMTEQSAVDEQNIKTLFSKPHNLNGYRRNKKKLNKAPVYNKENLNSENEITEIPESIEVNYFMSGNADNSLIDKLVFPHKISRDRTVENLYLEPLKSSQNRKTKLTRKRKLCIDYIKCLPEEDIKKRMLDTSDIISVPDIAPSSKRLMILKETGCAEKLLCLPAVKLLNSKLLKLYKHHLKTCPVNDFDSPSIEKENMTENCRFNEAHSHRKISESELVAVSTFSECLSENSDETLHSETRHDTNMNVENDFPIVDENFVGVVAEEDPFPAKDNNLSQDTPFCDQFKMSDDFQEFTQGSKTSQEKWEYLLQGRIKQMLRHLKEFFKEKSVIEFSSLIQKERRLKVAQKFFCLLMLKKFEIITMKQSGSYGEIFISQGSNFELGCSALMNH